MSNTAIKRAQSSKFYSQLKSIPKTKWADATPEQLFKDPAVVNAFSLNAAAKKQDGVAACSHLKLLGRVAYECDESAFYEAVQNREFPPIKMKTSELELLRGGGAGFWESVGYFVTDGKLGKEPDWHKALNGGI